MRLILSIALLALAGCAGTNFVRPDASFLANGQTTYAQVIAKMGKPWREGTEIKNEKMVKMITYAYADVGGKPLHHGVTAGRSLELNFHNEILVGQKFRSSWAEDNTDFDEKKVPNIVKGKTTRAEVMQMLGRPSGTYIYPMIKAQTGEAVVYAFSEASGTVFNMKIFIKTLIVTFDAAGVAGEVEYSSSGSQ